MKSTKLYFILLSCVLSLGLSAQETYVMDIINIHSYSGPTYEILNVDFFNDSNYTQVFTIDSSRFTHPDMDGYSNRIVDFEFTKDRKQVYFIEDEGDLYRYTIATDSLEYLEDLTPRKTPLLVQFYTQINNIFFINDSILYYAGFTYGKYNINTGVFTIIRQPANHSIAFSDHEQDLDCTSVTKHKGQYYYFSNGTQRLMQLSDYENPETNKIIYDFIPSVSVNFASIISYQWDCDSVALFFKPNHLGEGKKWYKFDLVSKTYTFSHNSILRGGRYKCYNTIDWEECQRLVDLDEDDSTEPNIDFGISDLCFHTGIPISDTDISISNEFPLDSIDIDIDNPRSGQVITIQPGNYNVVTLKPYHKHLVNTGTTTNKDFEDAIKNALYIDTGMKQGGDIVIKVTAWYDGISGRTAKAKISIVNPLPNAGIDTIVQYCQSQDKILLSDLLSYDADKNGLFYKENEVIDNLSLNDFGEDTVYYIVNNQNCTDTSVLNIVIHPKPEIEDVEDRTLCYGQVVKIDLTDISGDILWENGNSDKVRSISTTGNYHYSVTNEYDCESSDTFSIEFTEAPMTNPVEAKICTGEVFKFMDKEYSIPGKYADTLLNIDGCDSVIFNIQLDYFDKLPIEITGDTGFCEGENTAIKIVSDHKDISVNNITSNKEIEISDAGNYHITGYDSNGCFDELDIDIEQYPSPEVITEDLLDITYHAGIKLPVEYFGDIKKYVWTPNYGLDCYECPYPQLTEKHDGIYDIEVINQYGCTDNAQLEVRFKKILYDIPNVIFNKPFNPLNGSFYVKSNTEFYYDLKIFNRWGNLIYSQDNIISNDANAGWQPEGKVNPGVFVYMITFKENEKEKVISGDITVL